MADRSGKTEPATQRRVEKARKEGQFPAAREFVAALQFMVFLSLLGAWGAGWFARFCQTTRSLFQRAFAPNLRSEDVTLLVWQLFRVHFLPLALGGVAVAAATLGFRLVTTRFGLSLKKLAPDPARWNPLSKIKELPRQNLPALLQAVILLPLFLWAVYAIARDKLEGFLALPLRKRGERLAVSRELAPGAFLESRRRVSGLRRGGPGAPDCTATGRTCA